MITIKHKGDFSKTMKFLNHILNRDYLNILSEYGKKGVYELEMATPIDSGETAASWNYEIIRGNGRVTLAFTNSNTVDGVNVAIILQYGHATRNGSWVEGQDYINPAIQPVFRQMAKEAWRRVINA